MRRNDQVTIQEVEALAPERIVISPGPCTPQEAGISIPLVKHFAGKVPILGVCLGHQAIGAAFGGRIIRAPRLMHGKTSSVEHDSRTIFRGIASPMICTRYHSLIVSEDGLPEELQISARSEGLIMGLHHQHQDISRIGPVGSQGEPISKSLDKTAEKNQDTGQEDLSKKQPANQRRSARLHANTRLPNACNNGASHQRGDKHPDHAHRARHFSVDG